MARKTALERFSAAIGDLLEGYGEDVQDNLDEIVTDMGRQGAKALRQKTKEAFPSGTGKYARGWKSQANRERMSTTATIYNDHYGLPHLLEHGHATRNGTSRVMPETPAHEHIAPIEEELVETFQREVIDKL